MMQEDAAAKLDSAFRSAISTRPGEVGKGHIEIPSSLAKPGSKGRVRASKPLIIGA
jgi:hypothetical protein